MNAEFAEFPDAPSINAMEAGALGFFTKPFCDQDLFVAIYRSLTLDRSHRSIR